MKSNRPQGDIRFMKWAFRIFSGIAVAVIYFFVFQLFFDTPIEYELKRSTRRIGREYERLAARYDTLQGVMENVLERDRGVYMMLFESDPLEQQDSTAQERIAFFEQLRERPAPQLESYFAERLERLERQVTRYDRRRLELELEILSDQDKVLAIPAIQPVDNRQLNLLAASFGLRIHPFFKTMNQHDGVDYSVPIGTAVFATADGWVRTLQSRGQTSGLSVVIDHGNGYETFYGHLDRVSVRLGERVSRGDIIALSGNSGLSFGPHLHYEVRYRGKPVDPLNYFFMELDMPRLEQLRAISRMGMQSMD